MHDTNSSKCLQEESLLAICFGHFWKYLPVAIFLAVASLTGMVGNIFAVKFYARKAKPSSFIVLVKALAYVDFIVSALLLSASAEVAMNYAFKFRYICKISYFLFEWTIYVSILILVAIMIDRYRKICKSMERQLSPKMAKYCIPAIVVVSLVLSVRCIFLYDTVSVKIQLHSGNGTVYANGYFCTTSTEPSLQTYIKVFHIADITAACINFSVFTITYGLIITKLIRHKKYMKELNNKEKTSETVKTNSNDGRNQSGQSSSVACDKSPALASTVNTEKTVRVFVTKLSRKMTKKRSGESESVARTRRSEYKITVTMIWVSVMFLLSMPPFFIASLLFRESVDSEHATSPFTQLMIKCVFLNSVSNPIIYYICNEEFRAYTNAAFSCKCLRK